MPQSLRESKSNPQIVKRMAGIISVLLTALPLILLLGYASYTSVRYFVFGAVVLYLSILMTKVWSAQPQITQRLFKRLPVYGLVIYFGAFLLVSLTGINPTLSIFSTFQRADGVFAMLFLALFALSVCTTVLFGGEQTVRKFLKSSTIGAVLLSVLIDISPSGMSLFTGGFYIKSRGGATIGNSSLAALYIVWHVFFALWLFLRAPNRGAKTKWGIALGVLLTSPLFLAWHTLPGQETQTGILSLIGEARGAILGSVIGFLIALGVWLMRDAKKRRVYSGWALTSLVVLGCVFGGGVLLDKTSSLHQSFDATVGENRFLFWDSAVAGFKERPLLGWGPGTFSEVYHRHFDPAILAPGMAHETLVDRTHNLFFETLVGGGTVLSLGLLFYLFCIGLSLVKLVKRDRLLGAALIGACVAWLVQSQFVFDSIVSLAILALVTGIGLAADQSVEQQKMVVAGDGGKVGTVLVSLAALGIFVWAIALPMWKAHRMYSVYDMHLPARADKWQTLSGISPMGDNYDSVILFSSLKDVYFEQAPQIRVGDPKKKAVHLQELDGAIAYLKGLGATGREVYDILGITARLEVIRLYIDQAGAPGMKEDAIRIMQRMLELSPADPRPQELEDTLLKQYTQ